MRAGSHRRRLSRLVGSPPAFGVGGSTALVRFGKASVLLRIAIAATKRRWKLG